MNRHFNVWLHVDVPSGILTLLLRFFWKMYLGEEWGNNPKYSLAARWTDYIMFSTKIYNILWKSVASLANVLLTYYFVRFNDNKDQSILVTLGEWCEADTEQLQYIACKATFLWKFLFYLSCLSLSKASRIFSSSLTRAKYWREVTEIKKQ